MRFKQILSTVQSSDEFKDWYASHGDAYLAHLFFTDEGKGDVTYDIGYYVPSVDKIASFEVDGTVSLKDFSEAFKKPGTKIQELEIDKVKISAEDALKKSKEVQEKKYPKSVPFKRIVILQHLDKGNSWNITYVTQAFETLNIKVSAETGKVVEDKVHKIFEFDKPAA